PTLPVYSDPEAWEDYRRAFLNPETIHAFCEDYRAGVTLDAAQDNLEHADGRRIACPILALWGRRGDLEELYGRDEVLAIWRSWAQRSEEVSGRGLDCGHHLAEEAPEETAAELGAFFTA
ncbi:MAG TPA: hypothetical protein VGP82_11650, partial [Ktedonobacterales bacterium]|nr:hypothetical protein [Ktedonobacterales bacterium]